MVTKVEKTVYVDNKGREFDTELEAELSECRISLGDHYLKHAPIIKHAPMINPSKITNGPVGEIVVTEEQFHECFIALSDQHIYAFANYFNALIQLRESQVNTLIERRESE